MTLTGGECVLEYPAKLQSMDDVNLVVLKMATGQVDVVPEDLQLAQPLKFSSGQPESLWLGPCHWLMQSTSMSSDDMIERCNTKLDGMLYNAVDYSDALSIVRIEGAGAREILKTGTGLDLRATRFPERSCAWTRLAQVAAIIVARDLQQIDLYVDRSFQNYLTTWLQNSISIRASACSVAG